MAGRRHHIHESLQKMIRRHRRHQKMAQSGDTNVNTDDWSGRRNKPSRRGSSVASRALRFRSESFQATGRSPPCGGLMIKSVAVC